VQDYDVVVVGAGPGGYVAAIRAGQLGLKTAVVERDELGGVCLNWGCVPTKALLRNAEVVSLIKRGEEFGISFDNLALDFSRAVERSRDVAEQLSRGVAASLMRNKVEVMSGEGRLVDPHTVELLPDGHRLSAGNVIIATGARPRSIPALPVDGEVVITSREALELRELPEAIIIVGAGPVGVEFASLYHAYGVDVTLVEMLPRILPLEDEEICQELEWALTEQGISLLTGCTVTGLQMTKSRARVKVTHVDGESELESPKVLVATGVQPNSDGIGLEDVGVQMEKGFVVVGEQMETNVPSIFAVGDVTGKALLAHVASAQGVTAVEAIAGLNPRRLEYRNMPRATYCFPQVASFGLTEKEAKESGLTVKVSKFPFWANAKALAMGESVGRVKLVVDENLGEIVGAHMIGPEVTEMLGELSVTQLLEGTTDELGWLVHCHPSLSEAIKEAALGMDGQAIHI